jgi:TonB family protein
MATPLGYLLPRQVRVACSSVPDLNENAIETVKTWRFEPGTKGGKPVAVEIAVEVDFKLYN